MSVSVSTGPSVSAGPMLGSPPRSPDNNFQAGPSVTYQGDTIPDVRFGILGAADHAGGIRAHLDSPYILMTDAVPSASAATPVNIAAAQNTISGTAMTLAAPSAGITKNIPFYPLNASSDLNFPIYADSPTLQLSGVTLDFGFTTLSTTAGSTAVVAAASTQNYFYPGQSLVIAGAGNVGGTLPLITTVLSVGTNGAMVLANAPASTNATAAVGQGNILDPLAPVASSAWTPRLLAGVVAMFNPADGVARGTGIACSAAGGGGVFLISGWDIYGMPMSEQITHPGGAVTVYGKKAFKHIGSVTPAFTDGTRTYSVGTSDLLGFNLRSDKIEYGNFYANATFNPNAAGWTPADTTSPALPTTGDVRGTLQIGNRGPLGTGNGFGSTALGGFRVALFTSIPLYNLVTATPANPAPLYGSNQA